MALCGCVQCARAVFQNTASRARESGELGYSLLLVTSRSSTREAIKLSSLLTALNTAWRKTRAGRAWQKFEQKYELAASVSALEITYSQENGFHPHKHVLFFSKLPESELQVAEFEAELSARWRKILEKSGNYGSEYYALNVLMGKAPVAGYLAKNWSVAEELTLAQAKSGNSEHFTMWQVLEQAGNGEKVGSSGFQRVRLRSEKQAPVILE